MKSTKEVKFITLTSKNKKAFDEAIKKMFSARS